VGNTDPAGTLYQVDVGYACYGVIVSDDRVTVAAPIARWMVGKRWANYCAAWVLLKGGTVTKCPT
jgi:hypothetical protein